MLPLDVCHARDEARNPFLHGDPLHQNPQTFRVTREAIEPGQIVERSVESETPPVSFRLLPHPALVPVDEYVVLRTANDVAPVHPQQQVRIERNDARKFDQLFLLAVNLIDETIVVAKLAAPMKWS